MTTTERPFFNTGLAAGNAPEYRPNTVVIRRASTPSDFAAWLEVCQRHFPETARVTVGYMQEQASDSCQAQSQFWMMEEKDELVGIRWTSHILGNPVASGVYGVVENGYRGGGRYLRLVQESESFLVARGACLITIECVDPAAFSDDPSEAEKATGRIEYFKKKHGYFFVDPSRMRYYRPDTDDPNRSDFAKTVQTGYVFGFKPLGDPREFLDFRRGYPTLYKSRFMGLYLASVQLDTGVDVNTLMTQFMAVQKEAEELTKIDAPDVPLVWDPAAILHIPQYVPESSLTLPAI